ncbi:hypothetical protein WG8_2518 [Paenibacillus sp. Aloe-11]|nr:hypothetical protein WG8_2518 [Paenibacillus sp. Aloe-11]
MIATPGSISPIAHLATQKKRQFGKKNPKLPLLLQH